MSRRKQALLGLLFAGLMTPLPAVAQESDWAPQSFMLDNGMQAVVLPDHRAPIVTHMIWYRVGSADETPGKSGLAHFLEHLMFKSTSTMPAGEFSRVVARNGGQMNAATSFDYTQYHFRVAKDRLPLMMRMEADRMRNLQLSDDEVLPERKVVEEERRSVVENNPSTSLEEKMWGKLYAGHPYGIPVIGHMEEVSALDRADALGWYRSWYGPENAILIVAGDITADELKPMAATIYGEIPRRGGLKVRALPELKPPEASIELTHKDPKVRQATWTRSWLGASAHDADAIALEVGVQVLGGGRTSRLYRALVEGGQAVAVTSYSAEMSARGPISVSASPAADVSVEEIEVAAMKVVEKLLAEGPTAEELARAKKMIAASAMFRRDNQAELANWYGQLLTVGLTLDQIEQLDERVASVSAEDVRLALKRRMSGVAHVDALLLPGTP